MATQAERDYIIQQATARNPNNPQLALWQYAQSIGFSPAQIDEYMGWGAGTSQNWAQANGLAQPSNPATPAFDSTGMTPIYAKKTIDARGAPREVDDTSKVLGYMKNNGDGTYSNYSTTGALERTYNPNNGLIGGLSQNLNAIGDDRSRIGSDFILPAILMATGAGLVNGAGVAGSAGASEVAAGGAGAGSAGSSGLLAVPEAVTPSYSLTGGTAALGSASPAATGAAMGGATALGSAGGAGVAGLLTPGTVTAAGALAGALGSGNTTTNQTQTRDPWAPAQQYLRDNLRTNANMQANYLKNPFSNEQKAAYQNYANILANSNANVPVMSQISNNFLASRRGQMPTMPQFTNGATSGAIDWSQYQNMGLLK